MIAALWSVRGALSRYVLDLQPPRNTLSRFVVDVMRNGDHFFPTSDTCHSSDTIGRPGRIFEDWKVCPPILPGSRFPRC